MDRAASSFLQADDPLYAFLRDDILARELRLPLEPAPAFEVLPLGREGGAHWIYRYADRAGRADLVCKFYGSKPLFDGWIGDRNLRASLMQREFENLARVRNLGFDRPPHQAARPLGMNRAIDCVLVTQYAPGTDLETALALAARDGAENGLRQSLARLARFLADLHARSKTADPLQGDHAVARLVHLADSLVAHGTIAEEQGRRLAARAERWAASGLLRRGTEVWVHGDASPPHFLFDDERGLTAIDLEGLHNGDPAEDVGRVMAEIRQAFFRHLVDPVASEPYLQHFCAAYRSRLPIGSLDGDLLMERARFFLGYFAASIGPNFRLDLQYRRLLIEEAERWLEI